MRLQAAAPSDNAAAQGASEVAAPQLQVSADPVEEDQAIQEEQHEGVVSAFAVPFDESESKQVAVEAQVEDENSDAHDPISAQIAELERAACVHLSQEDLWAKLDSERISRATAEEYLKELECPELDRVSCIQIIVYANMLRLTPDDVHTKTVIFYVQLFFSLLH